MRTVIFMAVGAILLLRELYETEFVFELILDFMCFTI